jgi:hypothetical protein
MSSGVAASRLRVGAKGGLFVYRQSDAGSKRYLTGEVKDYVKNGKRRAALEALQTKRRSGASAAVTLKNGNNDVVNARLEIDRILSLPDELALLVIEFFGGRCRIVCATFADDTKEVG